MAVTLLCLSGWAAPVVGQRAQGIVSLDDARLFYEVVGSGDPILVVHGGPGLDHAYLQPGLDVLARRAQLVYYDQRGTGRSDAEPTEEVIHIDRFIDDIDALRESLGHERITVLAHSFGSRIATRYAATRPDRVEALILLNPVEPGERFAEATAERAQRRRTADDAAELSSLTSSEAFTSRDAATLSDVYRVVFRSTLRQPDRIDELALDLGPLTARQGQDVARLLGTSMQGIDGWAEVETVEAPVLVVHGRYDVPPPEMSRALAAAFPNGTFVEVEAGHFPFMESPDEVRSAVAAFLATLR